ncbi:MAG TPA: cysteine--tRNA ligase [Candidatus Acidoferrales bacterium]|nr:cysteine--tRNA ligase [Candidatus Acidoferrales bacterium]
MPAEIQFHNTLSGRKGPFTTLHSGEVRMYTCGPTVYDFAHIGNFRTFLFQDILRRFLASRGFKMFQVMNLTDVDDRIIANAAAAGKSIRDYTDQYIKAFIEDCHALGMEDPEKLVRATDHIPAMVDLIERLQKKSFTYPSDGSIYYRIAKFPAYGKLSKIDVSGMQAGASERIDTDRYEKENARDFALWKAPKPGEHFWETEIGPGRPGWHIECSAMSMKYLGSTLDIHTGGVDLTFPHHENEIAQSEGATGKPFVRFWLHAEHLLVDGQKMSKSLGNFYTLRDLFKQGYKPSSIRLLLASVPYRTQLNFTNASLQQAASSVERLRNFVERLRTEKFKEQIGKDFSPRVRDAERDFDAGLSDDLNTAQALAAVFDLVRDANIAMDRGEFSRSDAAAALAAISEFDKIFDVLTNDDDERLRVLGYGDEKSGLSDAEIDQLIAQRESARKRRDFNEADRIRKQLSDSGIILEDTRGGLRWKRR